MKKTENFQKPQNMADQLIWQASKAARLRFWFLASRFDASRLSLLFLFIGSMSSVFIIGLAAHFVSWNLLFPSLGPTIFLQFYSPGSAMSCPRNTVLGHLIGAVTGLLFFWIGTLAGVSAATGSAESILLGALALGIGGTFMAYSRLLHPPAASTILIGAFGLLQHPFAVFAIVLSALLLSLVAWVVHKAAGIKFPVWSPLEEMGGPRIETRLGRLYLDKEEEKNPMAAMAARLASRQKLK
ncbi:MAG: hypothetical protein DSZ23_02660 [Thermodesulfatator sp.]|nr:MAG: hypothetical protein DSZ23_02660 [Thermodesulfatator sp.]